MPCHQAAKWPLAIIRHPIRLLTHNFRYWSPLKFHIWHLTKKQHRGQARIMGTHLLWILLLYSKKARRASVDCIFLCAKWRTRSFLWHYPLRWILDQNVLKHIFIGYLIFFLCFSVTVVTHFWNYLHRTLLCNDKSTKYLRRCQSFYWIIQPFVIWSNVNWKKKLDFQSSVTDSRSGSFKSVVDDLTPIYCTVFWHLVATSCTVQCFICIRDVMQHCVNIIVKKCRWWCQPVQSTLVFSGALLGEA